MADQTLSFSECDREPIHLVGGVQSHGALIALDSASETISHASANCGTVLGHAPADLIGQSLEHLLGKRQTSLFDQIILDPMEPDVFRPWPCDVVQPKGRPRRFHTMAHENRGKMIVEFFKMPGEEINPVLGSRQRHDIIDSMRQERDLDRLCARVTRTVRTFTGFDRAMVYRFDESYHGEVIAEDTDLPDRYLHLHYPATDIPPQARAAYLSNLSRSITDVNAPVVPVLPACHAQSDEALDLSFAKLRAVSPVHLQYLRNMGVGASMSISIIVDNALWGLIACHHRQPFFVPSQTLMFCEMAGKMLAAQIGHFRANSRLSRFVEAQDLIDGIMKDLGNETVRNVAERHMARICTLLHADGVIGRLNGDRISHNAPEQLDITTALPATRSAPPSATTVDFGTNIARPKDQKHVCRGGLLLRFGTDTQNHLAIFRNSQVSKVRWAGNPSDKDITVDANGQPRIGPRRSFQVWTETIEEQFAPFTAEDVELANRLCQVLEAGQAVEREAQVRAAMREVEAQRDAMRQQLVNGSRLMGMAEIASSISHELNQPLTALINFAEACRVVLDQPPNASSHEQARSLAAEISAQSRRAGQLVHHMRALVKRRPAELRTVDMASVLKETVPLSIPLQLSKDIRVSWNLDDSIPGVLGDRIQLSQVFFNIVRNAVEAMSDTPDPSIRVELASTKASPEARTGSVEVRIQDSGPGIDPAVADRLYEPFVSTKADGMGIGLALSRTIIEAHGGTMRLDPSRPQTCFVITLPFQPEDKGRP